ncbi:MAG: hypothetical protein E6R03_14885 [Hyphomicrobiaceae bacterium]|nr:MAG: hypothetical protein E6R03_14885 [Hyphomicrobiaceae bacterium]
MTRYRNVGTQDLHLHNPEDTKVVTILAPDEVSEPMVLCPREHEFLIGVLGFLAPEPVAAEADPPQKTSGIFGRE